MELFDQVRAAPPPDRIKDTRPVVQTENGSGDGGTEEEDDDLKDISMPSPVAVTPSPDFTLHNKKANAETNEEVKLSGSAKRKISHDEKQEEEETPTVTGKTTTDTDLKVINDEPEVQTDIEMDGDDQPQQQQQQQLLSPPKTKAEQKMFIDHHHQPESTTSIPTASVFAIKGCHVRVKRLTQKEISFHTAGCRRGSQRKRARISIQPAAGSVDPDSDAPSPSKKAKQSNKIHIKVPCIQNGAKQRNLQKLAREHTPPPSRLNRKAKGKNSPSSGGGGAKNRPIVGAALIKRYGPRFFGCVVKVKRTPMPFWPVKDASLSLNNSNASSKRRSKKQNLSVSFSEAVEIFGSSETETRRSTLGSPCKGCVTVPTRLQRVDATGNILEDIALTSNAMLYGPSPAKRGRRSAAAIESAKATCNGVGSLSRKLKRSSDRVPVAGLASLRLEDKSKATDEDENGADDDEYIVPNELPGIHRAGTPIATPIKKKITITTTTISDEDDDNEEEKEAGESLAHTDTKESNSKEDKMDKQDDKEKEILEKESINEVNEKDELNNDEEKKKEQEELFNLQEDNEKEEEDAEKPTEEQSEETKEKDILLSFFSSEKEETTNIITETETQNITEKEKETLIDASDIKQSKETGQMEDEETAHDEGENNMEPLLVSQTDISSNKDVDDNDNDEQDQDKEPEAATTDDDEKKTNNDNKLKSSPLFDTTTISGADILEIATSLEDVRDLHTPLSTNSRCSTPQGQGGKEVGHIKEIVEQLPLRSRLDSGDSESSFKSATELNTATDATNLDNPAINNETTTTEAAEAAKSPATTTTTTTTKSESLSGDTDSITTPPFSAIGVIPCLNDAVLEELAEPDFQLNNSRHAISTGTLDDIMTALES